MLQFIDTHTHLDGEEYREDFAEVVQRAKDAGCMKVFIPGVDLIGAQHILDICASSSGFALPMLGLHPEEVGGDYKEQLSGIRALIEASLLPSSSSHIVAIGEVGLDFYWSRDYYDEQLRCFEEQVGWAIEFHLPLMIHCRKGQAEMVRILRRYEKDLFGGVFHCFTGNEQEAKELLSFKDFVLGIGGVSTFKNSNLLHTLSSAVPFERIVLETDSPYMAPVPMRGKRNEPSFIPYIIRCLAESYSLTEEEVCRQTNENVARVFSV